MSAGNFKMTDHMPEATNSTLLKKFLIPPLLVIAILVSVAAATMPDDNLHVTFLNVGQGDAILISQGNQQLLVDGGPSPQALNLGLSSRMPFWDRTIELVMLTHPDADHVTGLVEALNRYRVEQVLHPGLDFESGVYREWLSVLQTRNIEVIAAQSGQLIKWGEVAIEVLNPQIPFLAGTESDIDNNGIVLRLSRGKISFLLAADIMQEAELELVAGRANLPSTVLKVAHHGSATSTTSEFLAVVNPRIAVISVGADNKFGHPTPEVLGRLEQKLGSGNIYHTDENGTIEFITDGERLWVNVEK